MFETIKNNLGTICDDTRKTVLSFKVSAELYLVYDYTEEDFYWTDHEGSCLSAASVQSVQSVLGSQYGQQSS